MSQPIVLVLTGTCGSGKSTVAQILADRHGWIRLSEDDVWRERFHRQRGAPGSADHRRKRAIVRREMLTRIRTAFIEHPNIVVDATVHEASPDSWGEYRTLLEAAGLTWRLRVLHPRLDVAIQRDAARPDWSAGAASVERLWRKFTGKTFAPEMFLDTSDEGPEESARRVLWSLQADSRMPGS